MKKVTNYLLLFFMSATVLFVTSCGEDGEILPDPSASITGFQVDGVDSSSVEEEPGESVSVGVAYDLDGATGITLTAYIGADVVFGPVPLSSTSTNPVQTSFTVPESAEEDFVVTYELQDADGTVVDSDDFSVIVDLPVDATVYSALLLEAPVGQTPGERSSETFFSATTGETYTLDEVVNGTEGATSDSIHFGYYYGQTNQASLAAPSDYPTSVYNLGSDGANWGTLNDTKFRPIASSNFDNYVSSAEVAGQFEIASASEESTEITQLEEGDTYAFSFSEGDETNFGIFRVEEIVPGIESTGSITLTIKVAVSE